MAQPRLLSLPPELLTEIFCNCDDFADAFALASTCKRLQAVYQYQFTHIAWTLGPRVYHAFDLALIAVRATKIVADALKADKAPPLDRLVPISQLTGHKRRPNREDFREILKLQHFTRCVEHLMFLNAPRYPDRYFTPGETVLEAAVGWPRSDRNFPFMHDLWRERLHRNIYRLMICGAVLSAHYHQPFFYDGPEKPENFLIKYFGTRRFAHHRRRTNLSTPELQFLDQFPAFRMSSLLSKNRDEVEMMDPLTDWLLGDMKMATKREGNTFALYEEKVGRWPIRSQIMQCMWTLELLNTLIVVPNGQRAYGSAPISPWYRRVPGSLGPNPGDEMTGKSTTITIILHGVYQPEEITMPIRPGDEIGAGGIYTRHNLISRFSAKRLSKQMSFRGEGLRRTRQLRLCEFIRDFTLAPPPQLGRQSFPEHWVFYHMLQKYCGCAPMGAQSLIFGCTRQWHRIVSMLAFHHSIDSNFEGLFVTSLTNPGTGSFYL